MLTEPIGVEQKLYYSAEPVLGPVPRGNWTHFSHRQEADDLAKQMNALPGVSVSVSDYDPYGFFFIYQGPATPRMWQITGSYTDPKGEVNVVNEVAGNLLDRKFRPSPFVDTNPDSSLGGPYLHINTSYGYAELSWRSAPQ